MRGNQHEGSTWGYIRESAQVIIIVEISIIVVVIWMTFSDGHIKHASQEELKHAQLYWQPSLLFKKIFLRLQAAGPLVRPHHPQLYPHPYHHHHHHHCILLMQFKATTITTIIITWPGSSSGS